MSKSHEWTPAVWYGTTNPQILCQFDCYRNGPLWLMVYREGQFLLGCKYHFTVAKGRNSEQSYSGMLPRKFNRVTLEEAQEEVVRRERDQNRKYR
jgi:hypothetical protein